MRFLSEDATSMFGVSDIDYCRKKNEIAYHTSYIKVPVLRCVERILFEQSNLISAAVYRLDLEFGGSSAKYAIKGLGESNCDFV